MKTNALPPRRRQSGFALLITITLLAFLVLLLVSLAALTRVETRVASNNQQLSQARQNALMALNIALGQLQKYAGADQRTTATADIQTTTTDGAKKWTGVWGNRVSPASTTQNQTPVLINWLVSGNEGTTFTPSTTGSSFGQITTPPPASGAGSITTTPDTASLPALIKPTSPEEAAATAISTLANNYKLLVGYNTLGTSATTADYVVAPLQGIQVQEKNLAGFDPSSTTLKTIGNYAYWVGDEGVKAKVSLTDPWVSPTATVAEKFYRFVNAQRFGIEGVDASSTGTPLSTSYPANASDLSKIVELKQLPLVGTSVPAQKLLTDATQNRFHDLTASTYSLLTDVFKGGWKKDLTAWVADSTTNPAGSASVNAAYITSGDASDINKMWLPKWALIRDYATTLNTGAAKAPRLQTDSQQGIYPVITYARMAFGLSCANTTPSALPAANGGRYKYHIMPVVTLWNPYNVPIQASTDDSNTYEICFRYTHNKSDTQDVFLKLITFGPERDLEGFNLSRIRMEDSSGTAGYPGNKKEYGIGAEQQFWRFKVKLSRDLPPGESRLLTIDDSVDGSQYASGTSLLSDAVVDLRNSVYIPSGTGTTVVGANAVEIPSNATSVFLNTEPAVPSNGISYFARMQVRLTRPVPAGTATASINDFLVNNSYQAVLGNGYHWGIDTQPGISIPTETDRDENPVCAEHIELTMSSLNTTDVDNSYSGQPPVGHPRWLALLNPQSSITIRKPYNETPGTPYAGPFYNANPSYLKRQYIKSSGFGYVPYASALWRVPLSDGTANVSAGPQVSIAATGGTAKKLILREFQPAESPLSSLAQLQHVNVSALNLNPTYAIGNSLANLYVKRDDITAHSDLVIQDSFPEATTGFPQSAQTGGKFAYIYDLSYLLNKALWDGYFFSTVPAGLTAAQVTATYHLPDGRNVFYWNTASGANNATELSEAKATSTAAAHLIVNGGFNINSTSEQAWRALLYNHNGIATDPADSTKKHAYSRFTAAADNSPNWVPTANDTWTGYRILSDAQIDALARAIVVEVRKRGPFISLADFINRRLVDNETGLKGPLQAAIDATSSINGISPFDDSALSITAYPRDISSPSTDAEIYMGGTDNTQSSASRAAFAPGYLTQADLLTPLGPSLTARSDTFRIRTYGDTLNPVTGITEGRAWCEAIVQRLPDYVESTVNASTVAPASASTNNKLFGRRFKVVSFRWLSPNEI